MSKPIPHQKILNALLVYRPGSGRLFWRPRDLSLCSSEAEQLRFNTRYAGKPAFASVGNEGYLVGGLFGVVYQSHRVIWKLHHGTEPNFIDHINGDRADNRIWNLRDVSFQDNMQNQRRPRNNTSNVLGVYRVPKTGKWIARICINRKQINLGTFADFNQAVAARKTAEAQYGFHPNHGK